MPYPNEHACRLVQPGSSWTEEEARRHCNSHGGLTFEPAIKEGAISIIGKPVSVDMNCGKLEYTPMQADIQGSTMVLRLRGIVEQRNEGGISIESICSILRSLDSSVNRVIFDFDTPGGSVDGIQELTGLIRNLKLSGVEFIAVINPLCCSSGYWIASSCSSIYMASSTARTGSIGVVSIHEDISKANDNQGKKITEVVAGKYKRIDSENRPLTPEGRAMIQSQVDYIYSLFVDEISKNRNIPIERAISEIGDGRIFIGQQAVDLGLADGILSLSEVMEGKIMAEKMVDKMVDKTKQKAVDEPIAPAAPTMEQLMTENMELKKKIEELMKMMEESKNQQAALLNKEKNCAAEAERSRIKALEDIAPISCQATLAQAKSEGWTIERAALEFLKNSKASVNPLQSESKAIPSLMGIDENASLAKRMANAVNERKIR